MELKIGISLLASGAMLVSYFAFPPGKHQAIGLVLGGLTLLAVVAISILDGVREQE